MSSWAEMFGDRSPRPIATAADVPPAYAPDDAPVADPLVYQPWVLQRGRSRPAMMLELRAFEPRSGMWSGWQMSYPALIEVAFTGDRLVSLDFGVRQFVIEGKGLNELARHLQQGSVLAIQEYAPSVWTTPPPSAIVTAIRRIAAQPRGDA